MTESFAASSLIRAVLRLPALEIPIGSLDSRRGLQNFCLSRFRSRLCSLNARFRLFQFGFTLRDQCLLLFDFIQQLGNRQLDERLIGGNRVADVDQYFFDVPGDLRETTGVSSYASIRAGCDVNSFSVVRLGGPAVTRSSADLAGWHGCAAIGILGTAAEDQRQHCTGENSVTEAIVAYDFSN